MFVNSRINQKGKIINDPVYGFVNIPSNFIFSFIEHPYFQRLRRIKQLGLTYYIYPGAVHTRFQHSIGAAHLMQTALQVLDSKGHEITDSEKEAAITAILLHDLGHGPFSHTLEFSFIDGGSHESISLNYMNALNKLFDGQLAKSIAIFTGQYPKRFLHKLVSSQLDMDRLDYLVRDSFYTGVSEGIIGSERIIKMLNVINDQLVVEAKGIYSIEKFLIARRLMYWQVYFHKTVVAADQMLSKILFRARTLVRHNVDLFTTPALNFFLKEHITLHDLESDVASGHYDLLELFSKIDDYDIMCSIKNWTSHSDKVISFLSERLVNRKLFRIIIQNQPFEQSYIDEKKRMAKKLFGFDKEEVENIVFSDYISNNAYSVKNDNINILYKTGAIADIAVASDVSNVSSLAKTVKKYFICYPKECEKNK